MPARQIVRLLVFIIFWSFNITKSLGRNPLNGKHLRILTYDYFDLVTLKRNATGHAILFDGIMKQYLNQIANMYNFSFLILPYDPPRTDRFEPLKDHFGYIVKGKTDMFIGPVIATASRFKLADFPTPFNDDTGVGCLVAYPKETFSLIASLKPLSYQVWILIISGAIAITMYLHFSKFFLSRWIQLKSNPPTGRQITNFVWGNLVSQGQSYSSTRIIVRIAAGTWCVGCFFLVQIYCSTLTSHLMSPNQKPIISSVNELPSAPGVSLTANKGFGLELILRDTSLGTRNLKLLSNKLLSDPKLLCNTTARCLEIVDEGHAAYCNPTTSLKTVVGNDLKTTGSCHYLIIKDTFLNSFAYTPLQKNSPYTEFISRGTMICKETGLFNQWISWYVPTPWQCMKLPNNNGVLRRMSISNLSSAFIILFIGYSISIIAFCYENIIFFSSSRTQVASQ